MLEEVCVCAPCQAVIGFLRGGPGQSNQTQDLRGTFREGPLQLRSLFLQLIHQSEIYLVRVVF